MLPHTIQYGLENEIKVKKEMMMIFLMIADEWVS